MNRGVPSTVSGAPSLWERPLQEYTVVNTWACAASGSPFQAGFKDEPKGKPAVWGGGGGRDPTLTCTSNGLVLIGEPTNGWFSSGFP